MIVGPAADGGPDPRWSPVTDPSSPRQDTVAVTAGRPARSPGAPLNTPLVLASNFHASVPGTQATEYVRDGGTDTWAALEDVVGSLEGGRAVAFSSGMAAGAAVLDMQPAGSTIVVPTDSYAGVRSLLAMDEANGRWVVRTVDVTDTEAMVAAAAGAQVLWLESPTNPLIDVADLPVLCRAGRAAGALVVVDNTFATPLAQLPLTLGADVVVHSATKFIGGHSDLMLGIAVAATEEIAARLRRRRQLTGALPGGLEAFLGLRGIRTMPLRLQRSSASALVLAERLAAHPAVDRVRYPGLPADPGHARAASFMTGFGAMLSFELAGGAAAADAACAAVRVVTSATSLGGVETTIERRAKLPGQEHIPPGLLRMSVGIENVEDIWDDLTQALAGT